MSDIEQAIRSLSDDEVGIYARLYWDDACNEAAPQRRRDFYHALACAMYDERDRRRQVFDDLTREVGGIVDGVVYEGNWAPWTDDEPPDAA